MIELNQLDKRMKNIYIIGDGQGCYKTLLALINKIPNKFDSKIYVQSRYNKKCLGIVF